MSIDSIGRIAMFCLFALGAAFAQGQSDDSPGIQAVIAFMNILDHETVEAIESPVGTTPYGLATGLLERLEQREVLPAHIGSQMRAAIDDNALPRETFILFLADLLNWTDPLEVRDVPEAETILESRYCGLTVPAGALVPDQPIRLLDNRDVGAVVRQFLDNFDCIVPGLQERYRLPVE